MSIKRIGLILLLLIVVAAAGAFAWANRFGEIEAIAQPDPAAFDRNLVERGELLVAAGNCRVCHTAAGGSPFAGGFALPTPFGVIHSTNITPDPETGIGSWSEEAFVRAMREGVNRGGDYLYPAFPYDYFTKTSDEDLGAIYAYLMSQPAVVSEKAENGLSFPFNMRILLAGWNFLFHDAGAYEPDPSKDDEWNRGAYLAQSLGHCGACHTPRNMFGAAAKQGDTVYDGGYAEGWYAPPLNAETPAPVPWTLIALVNYLIDGWDADHGIAGGPMMPISNGLYEQSEDDVFAIAAYLMSYKGELSQEEQEAATQEARAFAESVEWGNPSAPPIPDDPLLAEGARVFEAQCSECHEAGGEPAPLALSTVVNAPDASNLIMATFHGIQPPRGSLDRSMPARAIQINDDQMVALAAFVRSRFSQQPAWEGVEDLVRQARNAAPH